MIQCVFCDAKGVNVNGHTCVICGGTRLMRPIGPTKNEEEVQ